MLRTTTRKEPDRSMLSTRLCRRIFWATPLALSIFLAAMTPSSHAVPGVVSTFGAAGSNPSEFGLNGPRGVAVDPTSGDVYVVDSGNHRVQRFSASGTFRSQIGTGTPGALGGQFNEPQGIAADRSDGSVYVTDGASTSGAANRRVQKFSSTGTFLRAWGWNVLAPTGSPQAREVQSVRVSGTAGTFTLTFNGQTTAALSFAAPAGDVEAALEALSTIGGVGAGVSVVGGPGDATGSTPYRVTFDGGSLAGADVPAMSGAGSGGATVTITTVNPGATGLEMCSAASQCLAGTTGSGDGQFGRSFNNEFVGHPAVDPVSGKIWVADPGGTNRRVQLFDGTTMDPTAIFEGKFGNSSTFGPVSPSRVSVGSDGSVYAVNFGNSRVDKCSPSGAPPFVTATCVPFLTYSSTTQPVAVAVNNGTATSPGNGNILVAHRAPTGVPNQFEVVVDQYRTDGTPVAGGTYGAGVRVAVTTLATQLRDRIGMSVSSGVGGEVDSIYLSNGGVDGTRVVYILGDVTAPTVVMDPVQPTAVNAHEATFTGEVNPNGTLTRYRFELSQDGGATWMPLGDYEDVGSGTAPVAVTADAKGLVGGQTYQVRISAEKPFGNPGAVSNIETFTTDASGPEVAVLPPEQIRPTSVLLRATVNPSNLPTTYRFEFGPTLSYGRSLPAPDASAGSGNGALGVSQYVSGLEPGATYHYRLVASNAQGVTATANHSVTTRSEVAAAPGRGYELVTPAHKSLGPGIGVHGANSGLDGETGLVSGLPSVDGEQVAVSTGAGPVLVPGATVMVDDHIFSRRTATGWLSESAYTRPNYANSLAIPFLPLVQASDNFDLSLFQHDGGQVLLFPEMNPDFGSGLDSAYLRDGHGAWRLLSPNDPSQQPRLSLYGNGGAQLAGDGSAMTLSSDVTGMLGSSDPSLDQVPGALAAYRTDASAGFSDTFADRGPTELLNSCTAGTTVPAVVEDLPDRPGVFVQASQPCPPIAPNRSGALLSPHGASTLVSSSGARGAQTNMVSDDGRRAFFMSPDPRTTGAYTAPSSCSGTGASTSCPAQLFVSQGGGATRVVRWISHSSVPGQAASLMAPVYFDNATPDGDKVFFRTTAPLTADDPNGTCGAPCLSGTPDPNSWDLYMYDLPDAGSDIGDGALTRISKGPSANGDGNVVQESHSRTSGAVRFVSSSGERVYFTTARALPGVPPASSGTSTVPADGTSPLTEVNLYLYDDTGPGGPSWRFIAKLPRGNPDGQTATAGVEQCATTAAGEGEVIFTRPEEGSSNDSGRRFLGGHNCVRGTNDGALITLFTSGRLVGADPDASSLDMYAYDAHADHLTRMSSAQGGAGGDYSCHTEFGLVCNGDPGFMSISTRFIGQKLGVVTAPTDPGSKIAYFESKSRLTPDDRDDYMDVYEWRDGSLTLMSQGVNGAGAYYGGNSSDGEDLFIVTTARLTWQDIDAVRDIYNVRVGGGFPEPASSIPDILTSPAAPVNMVTRTSFQAPATRRRARKTLRIRAMSPAMRRRATRTGRLTLRVKASDNGLLRVTALARIGTATRVVGRARKIATKPGVVTIRLRLSGKARRVLRTSRSLRTVVRVRQQGARSRSAVIRLPGGAS